MANAILTAAFSRLSASSYALNGQLTISYFGELRNNFQPMFPLFPKHEQQETTNF